MSARGYPGLSGILQSTSEVSGGIPNTPGRIFPYLKKQIQSISQVSPVAMTSCRGTGTWVKMARWLPSCEGRRQLYCCCFVLLFCRSLHHPSDCHSEASRGWCFKTLLLSAAITTSSEEEGIIFCTVLCSLALKLNIPYSLSLFCICSANPPRDTVWEWDIICLLPVIDRFTGRSRLVQMNTTNATIHPQQSVFNCMYSNVTVCNLFSCCHLAFWVKSKGAHWQLDLNTHSQGLK